jgi:cytochrome c-type biogenesis protein CcmF
VNVPIALALIVLTGIGPLISWRRATPRYLLRNFLYPCVATLVTALVLFLLGVTSPLPLAAFAFCTFVIGTIALEFYRGTMARRRNLGTGILASFVGLVDKNKRRYGGYLVHLGMMILFIGVAASNAFQTELTATVKQGESFEFASYRVQFMNLGTEKTANMERMVTRLKVWKGDRHVDTLYPERRFYQQPEQSTTEVDRHTPLSGDLYLIFIDYNPQDGSTTLKAFHNPLVKFVWIGWIVVILGTGVAVLPERQWLTAPVRVRENAARAAGRA